MTSKRTAHTRLSARLQGGDLRSLGQTNAVVRLVLRDAKLFPQLLACMWGDDPVIRMRAADAAEKISRERPLLLQPFKSELLGLAAESAQQEVQWHLALMLPRLQTTASERRRVVAQLKDYLHSRSSIVKTLALQGLSDLAQGDEELRPEVLELLAQASRAGTAAMKARARKLLLRHPS